MLQYYPLSTIGPRAWNSAVSAADSAVFRLINSGLGSPRLDGFMIVATTFGTGVVQSGLCLVLIALGMAKDNLTLRRAGYAGLVAFAISGIGVQIAKLIWHRPRPLLAMFDVRVVDVPRFTHSFPSGHTMTAFAVAVAISAFLPRLRWLLLTLACLTAISRVYLGVHFPLDVAYGGLVGVLMGILSARVVQGNRQQTDIDKK